METEKTGLQHPIGLAFSSTAGAFFAIDGLEPGESPSDATDIIKLTTFARRADAARIAAQIKDPINVTFDNKIHRLLILQFPGNHLLDVRERSDGNLDPKTLIRFDARPFGLRNPQGMTVDPTSGVLFILDAVGPRIVRIEPRQDGNFDGAVISVLDLQRSELVAPRGLALDPTTSHFYLVSPAEQKLYELSQSGVVVTNLDLSQFRLGTPQGMVFASSGDQTDDPSQISLYLADSSSGQISEFSLTEPVRTIAAASSVQSALLRTTNLALVSPPSPDPSGLTYLPLSNTLLISDSEVEEKVSGITHFAGANLWEITLNGSVVRTANISPIAPTVVPMTDEPTGVAWNPINGHFYFSDDNAYKVFDLNPGIDGQCGTADDTWTSFDTLSLGISDPEGITFDTWNNQLFVVDGTNREIYQFTLTGSLIAHFDVATYGVVDPESVEFNPDSGTLFVLSSASNPVIVETTTVGALLQTIDVSANNAKAPAGLAYAPASDGSGTKHFYIVDRGIDNNNDPNIIDGKMYEMSAPLNSQPTVTNGPSMTATGTFTSTSPRTPTLTPTVTNTRTMTATRTFTPTRTNTSTITQASLFTPSVTNTSTITQTRTSTPIVTLTSTPTRTITSTPTGTPTLTATAASSGFPVTGVLDAFNRADGAIGANWAADVSSFRITGNQLVATSGGMIFWKAASFGPDQEAYITFVNIDPATTNMDLLLKSQTTTKQSFLEIGYNPVKKIIQVESYTTAQGYVTYGATIPVTFINGDQLGVRVTSNGQVSIYKNGVLLGVRDASAWPNYANGGYIGLLSWGGTPNSIYDNFGGGTLALITPTSTVTTAASPTLTPTGMNSLTLTASITFTPAANNTLTMTPTSTFTPTSTNSRTMTPTGTFTPTAANLPSATQTVTNTLTMTPTGTFTRTVTNTPTMTPSGTFTPTSASSSTMTPSGTFTPALGNTGFLSPAMNAAQTGGDGNGYEVSAGNAYADDGLFAVDNNSGTSTGSLCTNAGKDRHRFYTYNITIPARAVVKGIQVRLDAKADSTSGSPKLCVQLSWDGGTTWTSAKSTTGLTTAEVTYLLGGTGDVWGHTWTASQLGDTTFRVRVIDVATSTARDFSLDWVAVQVTYQ